MQRLYNLYSLPILLCGLQSFTSQKNNLLALPTLLWGLESLKSQKQSISSTHFTFGLESLTSQTQIKDNCSRAKIH